MPGPVPRSPRVVQSLPVSGAPADFIFDVATDAAYIANNAGAYQILDTGSGDIGGSTGAVDNAVIRANGVGGKTIQSSSWVISDVGEQLFTAAFTNPAFSDFTDAAISIQPAYTLNSLNSGTIHGIFNAPSVLGTASSSGTPSLIGMYTTPTWSSSANHNGVFGVEGNPVHGGSGTATKVTSFWANAQADSGSGLVTELIGLWATPLMGATANATSVYGVKIDNPTNPARAVNNYGLYVASHVTAATLNYNIYSAGATSINQLEGELRLGAASVATGSLKFNGTTSGTVTVKSADAAGTWSLTLPVNDGDSGQALTTDGAGVTSWTTIAAGTTINATDTVIPYRLNSGAFADTPLVRSTANTIEQRNSTTAQTFRVYETYSGVVASDFVLELKTSASQHLISARTTDDADFRPLAIRATNLQIQTGGATARVGIEDSVLKMRGSVSAVWTAGGAGSGDAADTGLSRVSAGLVGVGDGSATGDFSGSLKLTGITMAAAGKLSISSGTNQRAGNATLVSGTVTISNTTVTANTIVMLTRKTSGGTIGTAVTYTLSAGTSFTITSDNVLDTSVFSYFLIEVP